MARKIIFVFLGIMLVASLGVFIAAQETLDGEGGFVSDVVAKFGVGSEVSNYVESFISKRGIDSQEIKSIKQVDFNSLPKEVNIESVGDTNLAIYQVDYTQGGKEDSVFMITYSVEQLRSQGDLIVAQDKRQFLNFGYVGSMSGSGFLKTATGVETSRENGYVMVRDGSVTGVSTNLGITQGPGSVEIIVYVNGDPIGFGNTFDAGSMGVKRDFDVQARDTVRFEAGDIISVSAKGTGDVSWKDVITMVEITTTN